LALPSSNDFELRSAGGGILRLDVQFGGERPIDERRLCFGCSCVLPVL
jgi:hypothetical protein